MPKLSVPSANRPGCHPCLDKAQGPRCWSWRDPKAVLLKGVTTGVLCQNASLRVPAPLVTPALANVYPGDNGDGLSTAQGDGHVLSTWQTHTEFQVSALGLAQSQLLQASGELPASVRALHGIGPWSHHSPSVP